MSFVSFVDQLHPLRLPSGAHFALQRGVKELDTLMTLRIALQQRICAIDQFAWPGLDAVLSEPFAPHVRWFREHWYQPAQVLAAGVSTLQAGWHTAATTLGVSEEDTDWLAALVRVAEQTLALYGGEGASLDYAYLQAEVTRQQALLQLVESQHHTLQLKTVRPLYRQLHPNRHLETLKGVGQDSAAVYLSFIGDPQRFPDHRHFRSWTGMIPSSRQSGTHEAQGVHITQAGPALVKKFAYLDADTARQWDPQMAALYYDQMVNHGKHHNQAVCCCATHLLDRVWTVLQEDRPYELRDVNETPVTGSEAREIITQRYTVPKEVRQHNNRRNRQQRMARRAERQQERESRASVVRGKA